VSRTLWFVAGAASGVYTIYRAKRLAQNLTPDGIGARLAALSVGARMFADEVSAGMVERESAIRAELGQGDDELRALAGPPSPVPEPEGADDGHR
jgi:Family of unknown function (DUF6167)